MSDIYSFLEQHRIEFEKFEHPAVFTCEEAEELTPDMAGAHTKNLLLRNRKGDRHFLVVVGYDKSVDLKALSSVLEESKLSFASPERLMDRLGLEPGAVTVLGLINDLDHQVSLVFDEAIWDADALQCHPLVNTATLVIKHEGLEAFLNATGHEYQVINVPERSST